MKKDKEWLKSLINEEGIVMDMNLLGRHDEQYWKNENIKINKWRLFYLIDQLDEPQKPVIPKFVADWIERNKQPDWDYDKKEDALADSIHFALYSLGANYPETNHDVVLRKPVNEWLNDDRKNYWKLIDGVRYGYEVEKEKKYLVKLPHESDMGLSLYLSSQFGVEWVDEETMADHITEAEIKAIDKRYWAFAEEVTE